MLGTELIGWFAEVLGKRPDGVQVQPDRGRRIMPDLEVLQHPLSKWCHSKNSFRCDHITNRLPAEPSTPWNVRDSALHLPEGLCSMLHIGRNADVTTRGSRRIGRARSPLAHPDRSGREGPFVSVLRNLLVGGPVAVRTLCFHSNQHGVITCLSGLHRCRKLEGMAGHDPIVMIRGGHQCGWIAAPRLYVLNRRILDQIRKVGWVG